jgi:cytochrome b6-f complex iron-sulfur subunit
MGCRPRWISESTRWECPCHGSVYDENGKVIGGPAPRPLPWYEVNLAADGRLFVDERRVVPFAEAFTVKT